MAFKILYTEDALADLENILDYIRAGNPAAAEIFGNALLNHVDLLAGFPHIGSPLNQRPVVRKILHTPVLLPGRSLIGNTNFPYNPLQQIRKLQAQKHEAQAFVQALLARLPEDAT